MYIKWFPDEVIGLYCGLVSAALTDGLATRSELRFTTAKLSDMIAVHLQAEHPNPVGPSVMGC